MNALSRMSAVGRALGLWLVMCGAWFLQGHSRPLGELEGGLMTDHVSHINRARLFPQVGLRLFDTPAQTLLEETPLDDGGINWHQLPSMYPVGMLILHAPLALAHGRVPIDLNHLGFYAVLLYLLGFSLFAVELLTLVGALHVKPSRNIKWLVPVVFNAGTALLMVGFLLYCLRYTLSGFYDVWPAFCVLKSVRSLNEAEGTPGIEQTSKSIRSLVWWSLGAFLHYRVFMTATIPLAAVWQLSGNMKWVQKRHAAAAGIAVLLGSISLWTFLKASPFLSLLPESNRLHSLPVLAQTVGLAAALGLAVRYFGVSKLFAASALFTVAAFALPHQVMRWHSIIALPLVMLGLSTKPAARFAQVLLWALFAGTALKCDLNPVDFFQLLFP